MLLYKYSTWENSHVQENIINNIWWFNTPIDFNDPFDTSPNIDVDQSKEYIRNFLIGHLKDEKDTIDEEILNKILSDENLLRNLAREVDRSKLENTRYGITCFSSVNNSILMWSHYGDQHKGICLGYEIPKDMENGIVINKIKYKLFDVIYSDDRPMVAFFKDKVDKDEIGKVLNTKSTEWNYEAEKRIFGISNQYMSFPNALNHPSSCLKELIIGANMDVKNFFTVINFLKKNKIKIDVFLETLDCAKYKVRVEKLSEKQLTVICNNFRMLMEYDKEKIKNNFVSSCCNIDDERSYEKNEIYKIVLSFSDKKLITEWKFGVKKILLHKLWSLSKSFFTKAICISDLDSPELLSVRNLVIDNIEYEVKKAMVNHNIK